MRIETMHWRGFGAYVFDLEIRTLAETDFTTLRKLLIEKEVIFLRGIQPLPPEDYKAFADQFWGSFIHPFSSTEDPIVPGISPFQPYDTYPEITGIYHGPDNRGNLNEWHSDLNWLAHPSLGSVLQAVELPNQGGDTLWASMTMAYDDLEKDLKSQLDGLTCFHDFTQIYEGIFTGNAEVLEATQKRYPAIAHPLVLTHPLTGRKCVFVNRVSSTYIPELPKQQSDELLQRLFHRITKPEYQIRHQWQVGDIAIWDNLSTQHYAVSDYFPENRKMHRISLKGVDLHEKHHAKASFATFGTSPSL